MLVPVTGTSIGSCVTRVRSSLAVVSGSVVLTGLDRNRGEVLQRCSCVGFDCVVAMSDPESWTLDCGGIGVAVEAADTEFGATVHHRLGVAPIEREPEIFLQAGPDVPAPPDGLDPQALEDYLGWDRNGEVWITDDDMAVHVSGGRVVVGGRVGGVEEEDRFDDLLQFGVAVAAATPTRLMLHAAVISRGDGALLLVGGSGAGKSTLAGAALVGGWTLLGDDLTVVDTSAGTVRAVRRPPLVPREIAEPHGLEGTPEDAPRGRTQLPIEVLGTGSRHLVGIVSVDHGTAGAVGRRPARDLDVLDDALAVPPFSGVIRRHLAAGAWLLQVPAVLLEHAVDPTRRVPRAIELLDEAWDLFDAG